MTKPAPPMRADVLRLVPHAKLVDLGGLPEGWDLADDAPDGVDIAKRLAEAKTPKGVKFSGNGKQKPGAKAKRSKKDDLNKSVENAKEREALLAKVRALLRKTVTNGCTEAEAEASRNKAKELMAEHGISDDELEFRLSDVEEDDFGTEDALRESAAGIIACKDVLAAFEKAWRFSMAGEVKIAKLLYLACTSRLFDRPMNAVIKGPSAAGKSEIRKHVLEFFPRRGRPVLHPAVREGAALSRGGLLPHDPVDGRSGWR